jgi:predicted PurR-regulated permease PerM
MDWVINVLNNITIPLICAVCLESLVYLLQYLFKDKKEDRNKYFKIFVSSLLFIFHLILVLNRYKGSFMDGVFRFVTH